MPLLRYKKEHILIPYRKQDYLAAILFNLNFYYLIFLKKTLSFKGFFYLCQRTYKNTLPESQN